MLPVLETALVRKQGSQPQHDELETNPEKILHANGICGLEAIAMQFHQPISKKSVSVAPVRKITKPRFRK